MTLKAQKQFNQDVDCIGSSNYPSNNYPTGFASLFFEIEVNSIPDDVIVENSRALKRGDSFE